jgi:hypothetical protein
MAKEISVKLSNGKEAGETLKQLRTEAAGYRKELSLLKPGTKEFIDASRDLKIVEAKYADIKKQADSVTVSSNNLKGAIGGVLSHIPGFTSMSGALSSASTGVGGLTSRFGILKTAIAATGIGLLVLAVGSLFVAFSKFAPLVDKVEQAFSGLGQVVDVIVNRLINVGKGLLDIVSGKWSAGINQISNSFDGMGEAMKGAYNAGVELKRLQQDLEDAARGLDIANARAEATIDRLIVQSRNKALTDKEQIALLQKAKKIAEDNFKANDAQKEKEFKALIEEAKLKSTLSEAEILQLTEGTLAYDIEYAKRGTISDDLLDKIKDAAIERIKSEGETNKQLAKIQNEEDKRLQARLAKEEKAKGPTAAEVEAAQAAEMKALERANDLEQETKFQEALVALDADTKAKIKASSDAKFNEDVTRKQQEIEWEKLSAEV